MTSVNPMAYVLCHNRPDMNSENGCRITRVLVLAHSVREAQEIAYSVANLPPEQFQVEECGYERVLEAKGLGLSEGEGKLL